MQTPVDIPHYIGKINSAIFAMNSNQEINQNTIDSLIAEKATLLSPAFPALGDSGQAKLLTFIRRYITSTPMYLDAFNNVAKTSKIQAYTTPFLNTACEYFFEPHPAIDPLSGMHAFLYKAYLCHRSLEELNDRVMTERQWPLVPADMGHVNLIVHTIIGDTQANSLDQTVLINLELISANLKETQSKVLLQPLQQQLLCQLKENGWQQTLKEWPILNEDITRLLNDSEIEAT